MDRNVLSLPEYDKRLSYSAADFENRHQKGILNRGRVPNERPYWHAG